jgi:HNH endonuclease
MASDPEFWVPRMERESRAPGRPRTVIYRTHDDYPPGNPLDTLCKLWQGAVDRDGYGVLSAPTNHRSNAKRYVHRWVWESVNGPIPKGMVIRHRCDNPVCFRLSHLELGSIADNNRDAVIRGHAGRRRVLSPRETIEICRRNDAGESYRQIHRSFPHVSLGTIKIARRFLEECLALVQNTAGPTAPPATAPTNSDVDAPNAPPIDAETADADEASPKTTPSSTFPGSS